jgi:hypothetical protein
MEGNREPEPGSDIIMGLVPDISWKMVLEQYQCLRPWS